MLIKHKANLNISEKHGDTPLIVAASHNRLVAVRALVEASADISIRNADNKTAAERAKSRGYYTLARYLITEAPQIRFYQSAQDNNGQLQRVRGRSMRAIERDLKESDIFVSHVLHRLTHFCKGKC